MNVDEHIDVVARWMTVVEQQSGIRGRVMHAIDGVSPDRPTPWLAPALAATAGIVFLAWFVTPARQMGDPVHQTAAVEQAAGISAVIPERHGMPDLPDDEPAATTTRAVQRPRRAAVQAAMPAAALPREPEVFVAAVPESMPAATVPSLPPLPRPAPIVVAPITWEPIEVAPIEIQRLDLQAITIAPLPTASFDGV